jgi:tetratricopeptide (TPR) repeat protein/CHAT domain-containing protein
MLRHYILPCVAITLCASAVWSQQRRPITETTDKKILLQAEGELTAKNQTAKGAYYKVHEVKLQAGTLYKIDLLGVAGLDTYLRLEDGKGKVLAEDDDSGGDLNARLLFRPTQTENYKLIATTFAKGVTGKYTLIVALADARDEKMAQRDRLWAEARAALEKRKKTEASALVEKALALEVELHGKLGASAATSLNNLGLLLHRQADYAGAGRYYEQALAIRKKVLGDNHRDTAQSLNNLGGLLSGQGDYAGARPYFEQALAIYKKALGDNHPDTANSLNNLGFLLFSQGDYAGARPYYEQALAIRKKVLGDNHPDTAQSLNNLGMLLYREGDYAGARPHYEQALAIRKKVLGDNHPNTATSLNNLGALLHGQGDYAGARSYYEQALKIRKKVLGDNHPDTAISTNNLGGLLSSQGDYAGARSYFEQALAIKKKVLGDNHTDTASSLNNLGWLLDSQGDYAGARPFFEQALAIRKKVLGDNHPDTASSLNSLGTLLSHQGDYAGARPYYEQALAIFKNVFGDNHPDTARSLNNLGVLLSSQGDYAGARPLFEQGLAIRRKALGDNHPDTANSMNSLGSSLSHQGDYAGARPYFEQGLAIRKKALGDNHPDTATSWYNVGWLLDSQGDYTGARPFYLKSLRVSRANLDLAAQAQSEREQFRMAAQVRNRLDSYLSFAIAAKVPVAEVYPLLLSWKGAITARQHLLKQALGEPGLAQLARDLQQTSVQLARESFATPDPKNREAWLRKLEKLSGDKEDLERKLAGQSKTFSRGLAQPRIEDLAQSLPGDAALVDFMEYRHWAPAKEKGQWTDETRLLAFVVRAREGAELVELGPAAPIEKAIKEWREEIKIKASKAGAVLRGLVWQPLEKHLLGAKTVLVSPDGLLNQLPFAALPGKQAGKYLIEEVAVVVAPLPRWLPQVLETDVAKELGVPSLLLLGDVDFAKAAAKADDKIAMAAPRAGLFKDWPELKGTRGEILAIKDSYQQRFPDGQVKELRGPAATESAVRQWAPKHQVLHLATHGFFAPAEVKSALAAPARGPGSMAMGLFDREGISGFNPGLLSGIVLAGANRTPQPGQDDGILTALAVQELDLRKVELVVLSACETGLGQVAGGEGILGLQRAFQVAGAKTVVASLWKVDDDATRKLMERFYDNLWSKKMSKLEALREAQLSMLRGELARSVEVERAGEGDRRLPPYYWAAFVLSGDWR